MSMHGDPLLNQIRRNVALSYGHKAVLLGLAVLGFYSLHWLGEQKAAYEKQRTAQWEVKPEVRTAIAEVTRRPICAAFDPPSGAQKNDGWCVETAYPARDQLILAMQDVAEASVWARFEDEIEVSRTQLVENLAKNPTAENVLYSRFAELVTKKEAYAKASASAIRRAVAARLTTINLAPSYPKPTNSGFGRLLQPALDSDSDTYVIYEILWYASLLLGVVASSLLLVVVFTALPITNAEGFWTTRISQLLEKSPGAVRRAVVPPILTAALAGGTFVGSAMNTEPGGDASASINEELQIDQSSESHRVKNISRQEYREGDINFFEEPQPEPPNLDAIKESIGELRLLIDNRLTTLDTDLREADAKSSQRLSTVQTDVEAHVLRTAQAVQRKIAELDPPVASTLETTQATRKGVDGMAPIAQRTFRNLGALTTDVNSYAQQSAQDARTIQQGQAKQEQTVQLSLARSAQSDPRGFLGRTFGPTLYQVGPLVIETMDARLLERQASDTDRKALHEALTRIQGKPPVNRRKLRSELYADLLKSVGSTRASAIVQEDFNSLLRVCALPR